MKVLTIPEAIRDLEGWLNQAVSGEEIRIRCGEAMVALKPLSVSGNGQESDQCSPREALARLQEDARLTPSQAEAYLNELRAERLANEDRGAA